MSKSKWMISESQLDDIQTQIATQSIDKSLMVTGCAGSGKTILALHRAKRILESDKDCIVVVYTRVLRTFIEDGIRELDLDPEKVIHYHKWSQKPTDYLIVDEIQDFKKEIIETLIKTAKKSFLFLGDQAQQLYKNALPINQIQGLMESNVQQQNLNKNYRLPKKIARVARFLQNGDEERIYEDKCVREGEQKPRIYQYDSYEDQLDYIAKEIKSKKLTDVGILLPTNNLITEFCEKFKKYDINFECRSKYEEINTLDFSSDNPKIMTYHSAKGCQFNDVFIPGCESDLLEEKNDDFYFSPLYVAFTRSINNVYVLYSNELPSYFDIIPEELYLTNKENEIVPF